MYTEVTKGQGEGSISEGEKASQESGSEIKVVKWPKSAVLESKKN